MDHAALQAQIAGCLQYAGQAFVYAGGSVYGSLERVDLQDPGVETIFESSGLRLTYSLDGVASPPTAGTVLTSGSRRYRIVNEPSVHPTANTAECALEEIQP